MSVGYSDAVKRARPGIASTNRPRLGSFASLVDQILDDDSALDGLAFAYAGLEPPERQALTRAVLQDAGDPTQALLTFLTVEENPRLRQRLLGLVSRHGRVDQLAYLEGTETEGTAHLKQSIPGLQPEVLHVAWKDCEILHLHVEPRTGAHSESGEDAVPIATVVQTLAPLLWQHIRSGGVLPTGIERFAGFFSVG
jgi:hypothetical protein